MRFGLATLRRGVGRRGDSADAPELPGEGTGDGVFLDLVSKRDVDVNFAGDSTFTMTTFPEYAWLELKIDFIPALDLSEVVPGTTETQAINLHGREIVVTIKAEDPWTITDQPG